MAIHCSATMLLLYDWFSHLGDHFGLFKVFGDRWAALKAKLGPTATRVYDLAVHNSLRRLLRLAYYGDQKVC